MVSALHSEMIHASMTTGYWQTLLWSSRLSHEKSNVPDEGKLLRGDNGGTENADLLKSVLSSRFDRSWNV